MRIPPAAEKRGPDMSDNTPTGAPQAKKTTFSMRRIFLVVLALLFAALCVFIYFRKLQDNRDSLTQHNIRHMGTITTLIEERFSAFESAMRNLRYSTSARDLSAASIRRNYPFDVNVTSAPPSAAYRRGMPDTMTVSRDSIQFRIAAPVMNDTTLYIRTTFAELLASENLTEDAYDVLLITNARGDTVYFNSTPELLKIERFDSVRVQGRAMLFAVAATSTNAGALSIAGRSYECYLQPMGNFRVCGLLATETFEENAQAVPSNHIVNALILLSILLLAAPLVSLQFAGASERVKPLDMFVTVLGIAVGFAFLMLLIADVVYLKYEVDDRENAALGAMADSIAGRTQREFAAVDRMVTGLSALPGGALPVLSRSDMFRGDYPRYAIDSVFLAYPYFEQLYWLDATGDLRAMWTTTDQQYSRVPLADREYFRKIRDGASHWIQPHYSRGTSAFMVAYSTATRFRLGPETGDTSLLVSVDFLPRSLVNAHVPEGSGYMIIDKNGDVLFHSILKRSLNENLFTECNEEALRDIVAVDASGFFRARYWENDVRMYGTPLRIHGQPWYLVVYSEQRMLADRKSGMLIMSMVLYLLFFVPVIVGYTVFLFVRDRHLAWMWFQPDRARVYAVLTIGFAIAAVLCTAVSLSLSHLPHALLIGCVVPHAGLLTAFYWLDSCVYPASRNSYRGRTRFTFTAQRRMVAGLHIAALVLYMLLLLTNAKSVGAEEDAVPRTALAVIGLGIAVLGAAFGSFPAAPLRRLRNRCMDWAMDRTTARRGRQWYVAMLAGLTMLLGIVPMLLFFRVAHDVDAIAYNRVLQSSISAHMAQREAALHTAQHDRLIVLPDGPHALEQIHRRDMTDVHFDRTRGARFDAKPSRTRYTLFSDSLLRVLMLPLNQGSTSLHAHLKGDGAPRPIPFGGATLYYNSRPAFFRLLPSPGALIPLALLCGLLLLMLYQVIEFGARRLFLIGIVRLRWRDDIGSHGSCLFVWTTENEAAAFRERRPPDFDVAAMPYPDAEWMQRTLAAILAARDSTPRPVIDHFDYRSEDPAFNILKLELLEHLLITYGMQVCLLCSVDPEYYLFGHGDTPPSLEIRERWKRVLNMMVHVYPSTLSMDRGTTGAATLESRSAETAAVTGAETGADTVAEAQGNIVAVAGASASRPHADELLRILEEECAHPGMNAVASSARDLVMSAAITSQEELLTWIGIHGKPFYQAIWTTFTKKEQLVLYHLAQDGFVPHKTKDILQQLMHRGIVFMDPALRVFSETFRLFILSAKTYEQIRHWEQEEPASFWSKIKHPVLIVVTVLAAALLYSKPDYFNSTLAILTALAGAIPLVLRLRGFLASGKMEQ
jgi:hypothetical protein